MARIFPLSYRCKDVGSFIVSLILYLVLPSVLGFVTSLLSGVPILGWILGIALSLIGLYCLIGIILAVLVFLKVIR